MDILLENGDELNLIMPKLARPFYFFSHQAFWHFDKLILLVESSQYFCILICIFCPAKHYQSRREIYTALFSADRFRWRLLRYERSDHMTRKCLNQGLNDSNCRISLLNNYSLFWWAIHVIRKNFTVIEHNYGNKGLRGKVNENRLRVL